MSLFSISKVFAQTPEEIVGEIDVPKGVDLINSDVDGGIGIVLFISNMIRFVIILGGIWALINIILAAFLYLTGGGKADTHSKVSSKFTMSVIGLLLMIVAYTVAALIGLIFYDNPEFILSPKITPIGG
ncbi:hypothetical protein KA017_03085 [Candidatus Woesebacteria bacterium]|nr:hypothetical protein [Candidatus Woesebacteria bacterium]